MESVASQKGLRGSSRKTMNPLAEIFGFRWVARYTFWHERQQVVASSAEVRHHPFAVTVASGSRAFLSRGSVQDLVHFHIVSHKLDLHYSSKLSVTLFGQPPSFVLHSSVHRAL